MDLTAISKFLSYILRHHPEDIGLELDDNGWAEVSELIKKAQEEGRPLDRAVLRKVMHNSSKQRFILSSDKKYIRAGYGHSIDVDLQLKPKVPPRNLYDGTAQGNVSSILENGIQACSRNFVHLSTTIDEARNVGGRYGEPEILLVLAGQMNRQSYDFYQSESEESIWLTSYVPPEFLKQV